MKRFGLVDDGVARNFQAGRTIHGYIDDRGRFVRYPDDYVPLMAAMPSAVVTAVDVERGIVTVESIETLARQMRDMGAQPDHLRLNPDRYAQLVAWVARLDRKFRRAQRMARKKRRGWA